MPLSGAMAGLVSGSLLAICKLADFAPNAVLLKVMFAVQASLAFKVVEAAQVPPVMVKAAAPPL